MNPISKIGAFLILLLTTQPAWSYLDPGTGSMLLQVVLGGVAAIVVGLKFYWHKLCALFGFGPKPESDQDKPDSGS